VLARRDLSARETALWILVDASNDRTDAGRRLASKRACETLSADEMYLASLVISLFNFYNTFVDLNGVDELTPEGYEASGVRLSTQGYCPPPEKTEP
jgi:hypothetical protein